ncbi:MAG: IclR family transcriptional regulator C-terminal domain-containing protein [Pseudomonadota bacterium]
MRARLLNAAGNERLRANDCNCDRSSSLNTNSDFGLPVLIAVPAVFKTHTTSSVESVAKLEEELKQIAKHGFAVNLGEWRDSVGGLASPIFDAMRRPVAAIGLAGPLDRLSPAKVQALAPYTLEVAQEVASALGYRGDAYTKFANGSVIA